MPRLASFLLASTALHAALLTGSAAFTPRDAGARHESIAVRLESETHSILPGAAPAMPNIATVPRATTDTGDIAGLTVATANTAMRTAHDSADAGQSPEPAPPGAAEAQARTQVIDELARHFYYPALARRQGWEGRVTLSFHIADDGQLRDPRVLQSSGFGILDEAALNSLRKVERIAARIDAGLDLQVPVVYRLTDTR